MSETAKEELVPVKDVNDFAQKTVDWHTLRVQRLEHILNTPEGTSVSIDGENGAEDFVLEGDKLTAFRIGIQVALHQLGSLPFVAEYERND